jgi:hypothetical protein
MATEPAIAGEVNDGTASTPAVNDPTSASGLVGPAPANATPTSSLSPLTDTAGTVTPVDTNTFIAPSQPLPKPIKLYKSTRLKGYMTLFLASFINYDSAQKSSNVDVNLLHVVPSNDDQRKYAVAVAVVSLIASGFCLVAHLDRITPLERLWIFLFQPTTAPQPPAEATVDPPTAAIPPTNQTHDPNAPATNSTTDGKANDATTTTATTTTTSTPPSVSTLEGTLALFLTIWWSIATGVATAVSGMAGDGKGQYSLYYSYWACTCTSYWILERCGVAAGWVRLPTMCGAGSSAPCIPTNARSVLFVNHLQSSLKSFISSWPHRSPAWICIMVLSFLTLVRVHCRLLVNVILMPRYLFSHTAGARSDVVSRLVAESQQAGPSAGGLHFAYVLVARFLLDPRSRHSRKRSSPIAQSISRALAMDSGNG